MRTFFSAGEPGAPAERIQGRLLALAAGFVVLFAAALTLSPSVRYGRWDVPYPWQHWIGVVAWLALFTALHRQTSRLLPERDPTLLPLAGLLSGWGLLLIYRLDPGFGLRQTAWLAVSSLALLGGLQVPGGLQLLRRYKYLWLSGGLLLTGLTFLFGTFPDANLTGPRLWLGCCGIYFQPTELLKLLLVVYLAAYLAEHPETRLGQFHLTTPILIMAGLGLALLLAQRDLGTASLFIFLFTAVLYLASERRRVLAASLASFAVAAGLGYQLFDVVRLRVDAWLNPWADPGGRSYQIVQSLIAIANGGIFGRGPGLGSPSLVPVAHSDFLFAALGEEFGLLGGGALALLLALLVVRGLRTALTAPDTFQRLLAAGLTLGLAFQSILIIGGNIRLLPLTGLTLPFVSYGGSSLLTSFLMLLILLRVSSHPDQEPAWLANHRPYLQLGGLALAGLAALVGLQGWWAVGRSAELLERADNPRHRLADRWVRRGSLVDRNGLGLQVTRGEPGSYERASLYPGLSTTLGYTHPVYGQTGLERSLDAYLGGRKGYDPWTSYTSQLLYGQPPPGQDVRLSLDLEWQTRADELLHAPGLPGAVVLLNARTGEILALASSPTFDANQLDANWERYRTDSTAPLLNRAVLGVYPPGAALGPFLLAASSGLPLPTEPPTGPLSLGTEVIDCVRTPPAEASWGQAVATGCPAALAAMGNALGVEGLNALFAQLGFNRPADLPLTVAEPMLPESVTNLAGAAAGQREILVSPLQLALAAATLSTDGVLPATRLVLATNNPTQGWTAWPGPAGGQRAFPPEQIRAAVLALAPEGSATWGISARGLRPEAGPVAWFVGGTSPDWQGTPLVVVVALEGGSTIAAGAIGETLLDLATAP